MKKTTLLGIIIVAVVAGLVSYVVVSRNVAWKTYQNLQYGYELQYPSNWFMDDNDPYSVFITNYDPAERGTDAPLTRDLIQLNIFVPSGSLEGLTLAKWTDSKKLLEKKNFSLAGVPALRGEEKSYEEGVSMWDSGHVFILSDTAGFDISYMPYSSEQVETFDQILATFKFIPATQAILNSRPTLGVLKTSATYEYQEELGVAQSEGGCPVLTDGRCEFDFMQGKEGAQTRTRGYVELDTDHIAYGEVFQFVGDNADEEAVVIIRENNGGSGIYSSVQVVSGKYGGYVSSYLLGDRVAVHSISIDSESGIVSVDMTPRGGPRQTLKLKIDENGNLEKVS